MLVNFCFLVLLWFTSGFCVFGCGVLVANGLFDLVTFGGIGLV